MAYMVPSIDPGTIRNDGERAFYYAASKLPKGYTVFYSFKYQYKDVEESIEGIKEADFIIVHPSLGYLVVEVKQGDIAYINGVWNEFKDGNYRPMKKDPVEQARNAMFAILNLYKDKAKNNFPLKIKYAVCFPECSKIAGNLPADLNNGSIFLFEDLHNLNKKIIELFDAGDRKPEIEAVNILLDKVLAPSFKVFSSLEDRIEMFHKSSEIVLTEEQQRILEETELDKRKIFLGAAGTGKTFLAKEKARVLAEQGKKVFLTCFNKSLAKIEFAPLTPKVEALNFHDYIENRLKENEYEIKMPETREEISAYYDNLLPDMAFDHFTELTEDEKFDAVIVDEGQDFKESWITCIESMVKGDGELYIFADPNQTIFNNEIEKLMKLPISKQKLTRNLRNTVEVNEWVASLIPNVTIKSSLMGGMPVRYFEWKNIEEEKKMIADEIGRLVSQGIQTKRIVILSPHKQEHSSLAGLTKIKDWPIAKVGEQKPNAIRFDTIRSFKGLEADIVFLIDIKDDDKFCSQADIYVGGSRARFMLYIFKQTSVILKFFI